MTASASYRAPFAPGGPSGIDGEIYRKLLEIALSRGGEYADLFFEYRAGGGLVFARFLFGPTVTALVLALWGFFLVQSLYFLLGGKHAPSLARHPDPFQDAYARATALLDRGEELPLT